MSEKLNMKNLLWLAYRSEQVLRPLTGVVRYQDMCKRVGIQGNNDPWDYRYSQILEQGLDVLSIVEQYTGATIQQQKARKEGLLPFHFIVNETGRPGSGYHKWWLLKEDK